MKIIDPSKKLICKTANLYAHIALPVFVPIQASQAFVMENFRQHFLGFPVLVSFTVIVIWKIVYVNSSNSSKEND